MSARPGLMTTPGAAPRRTQPRPGPFYGPSSVQIRRGGVCIPGYTIVVAVRLGRATPVGVGMEKVISVPSVAPKRLTPLRLTLGFGV
jgi:hypothetical protein